MRLVITRNRRAREKNGLEDIARGADLSDGAQVGADEIADTPYAVARAARAPAHLENFPTFAGPTLRCDQRWQGFELAAAGIIRSRDFSQCGRDDRDALGR